MENPLAFADTTRRDVLRKAVFIAPVISLCQSSHPSRRPDRTEETTITTIRTMGTLVVAHTAKDAGVVAVGVGGSSAGGSSTAATDVRGHVAHCLTNFELFHVPALPD
jgi:hypothetical protein